VDISSPNIPAVSFIITSIMPACCHQRNQAVRSELSTVTVKTGMEGRCHSFPSLIATHSQLEERTPEMPLNGIV
jgi:hypothetical protein